MTKILISGIAICIFLITSIASANLVTLNFPKTSSLTIHALENPNSIGNIVAIIGGAGLKNGKGKSKNYLVRKKNFFFKRA